MSKIFTVFSLIFFISLSSLFAENYYVSNVSEINSAMSVSVPGDTLILSAGEWRDVQIKLKGTGTEAQPIVIRAETAGQTRITGKSYLRIGGSWLVVDGLFFTDGYSPSGAPVEFRYRSGDEAQHCRLTNTAIVDYNPSSKSTDYKWISLYGQYNRVDHCYLKGKKHSGTTLVVWLTNHANYHRIDHNYFGERPDLGKNGGETIRIGTSDWSMYDSFTIVEDNYFEHCNGEIEIISNKSAENTYRNNTFFECQGTLTLRHGNRCYVYGNFFIGNNKYKTGGVRIIGEDHKVYNNYFVDLAGDGYRSALTMMSGVPNSPLNRYFQVKRAQVIFNTFVNCYENFDLGAGADAEKTLPPLDCIIANNLLKTSSAKDVITLEANPINLFWEGNIFLGRNLGITQTNGLTWLDPQFEMAADSLWRPAATSPALAAASGSYAYITEDMDGQVRQVPFDVGADQLSEYPIINHPLSAAESGPDWYPPATLPPSVIAVAAGVDSLALAIQRVQKDDIIELITDGGLYENTGTLLINKKIAIRAKAGLISPPRISQIAKNDTARAVFTMSSGGTLRLSGINIDGLSGSSSPASYAFHISSGKMSAHYNLFLESCSVSNFDRDGKGHVLRATAGSFADSITIENCLISNIAASAFKLNEEAVGSGKYNVEHLVLKNSTFWNIGAQALTIYAGDDIMFTSGPYIEIDHCTFDNCAQTGTAIVYADQVDFTTIKNSIFSNSPGSSFTARLYGAAAVIHHSDLYQTSGIELNRSAQINAGMLSQDPGYRDAASGDFSLNQSSPVLVAADDGLVMGDLRWADGLSPIENERGTQLVPQHMTLFANYPNPFNPSTNISFYLKSGLKIRLDIIDIQGRKIQTLIQGYQSAGKHSYQWQAGELSSGVYFVRLSNGRTVKINKMMLLR